MKQKPNDFSGPEHWDRHRSCWLCLGCLSSVQTQFCPDCGEKKSNPADLALQSILRQVFAIFTSINGKTLLSFRYLLLRPGYLSLSFLHGMRKPYLSPFKLFIISNGLFFALQSISGMRVFATLLDAQLTEEIWRDSATALLQWHLTATGLSREAYEPVYNHAVLINAKSLIGLMVPPFALVQPLLFWRAGRPFATHLVFSLHFYAFLLLLFCAPAVATAVEAFFGSAVMMSDDADKVISVVLLGTCTTYLYLAVHMVYDCRGAERAIKTALLMMAVISAFFAYRFAMLPLTLLTT